jgi:hypothetical protein
MSAHQILLLRVGMDLGFGALGPIFANGSFEYIPIPENPEKASSRTIMFSQIPVRSGGTAEQFLPKRYRESPAHYDPEFDTFTYGDPTKYKRGQLLRLARDDILVFYAGLRPLAQQQGSRLYLIGYFTIKNIYDVTDLQPWPPPTLKHLWANAHFRHKDGDRGLVVAEGSPHTSRLLTKAVPLSDELQEVLPAMQRRLGIMGSVKRAGAGRWVPPAYVASVAEWLCTL